MWRAGTLQPAGLGPDAGSATFQLVGLKTSYPVSLRLDFLIFKMGGDNGIYSIGVVVTMTFIYLHQNP